MFLPKQLVAKLKVNGHFHIHPNVQLLVSQWKWRKSIGSTTPQEFLDALESLLVFYLLKGDYKLQGLGLTSRCGSFSKS